MKKIMALVVLTLFLVSLVPVFAGKSGDDNKRTSGPDVRGVSEFGRDASSIQKMKEDTKNRHELLRERFVQAKDKFVESRKDFLSSKMTLRGKHNELKLKCKDNESTEDCMKMKKDFLEKEAKSYLVRSLNVVEDVLNKRKAKLEEEIASAEAQSQDATDLEANIEEVNAQLKVISDLKAKLDAATTKEEVKALTKEIKTTWKGIKSDLEGSRGTIMTHKFAFAVSRSKSLEAKLDRVLEKLKSEGKDVSSVQPKVDSFKAHIARAKELIEQARTKFADKSETSVKQGHELLVQAHQELKLAHSDLKEIVASFRAKGGAKLTEELEVSETDVSATTSTDTTSSSDTSTSDTQTTAVTGAVTVDLSSSESDNTVSTEVTTSTETTTYSTSTASAGCPFTEPTATCGTSLDSVETSSDTVPGVEEDTA